MFIALKPPTSPYKVHIDTAVMEVEITKAFIGPIFKTEDGESLLVLMRDSGFELKYIAPGCEPIHIRLNAGALDHA